MELFDFIIYQHLNKRQKILPLATSQIAHLRNQLIMFALPISMQRFKSIIFCQNSPKICYFCNFLQQNAKFSSAGGSAPRPRASSGWGLCPQTPSLGRLHPQNPIGLRRLGAPPPAPQNSPPLRNSGYAPGHIRYKID